MRVIGNLLQNEKREYLWARNILFIALLVLIGTTVGTRANADNQSSSWFIASNPTLQKEFDLSSTDSLPTSTGVGNRDCENQTVITRPSKFPLQSQTTATACFVKTTFGLVESNGLIKFNGTNVAGNSVNYGPYVQGLIAIPSSSDVINYTSAGSNGLYLHFTRSIPSPLAVTVSSTGEVTYRFSQPATASLRDKSGTLLPAQTDSLSFSSNGKWMVVDSPNRAMLRVNVDTLEAVPFTNPFNYNIGIAPYAQTAVSNDGRYVAVASKNFSTFKIFDLSTCGAVPNAINGPVNCQSRDLLSFVQSQIIGFNGAFSLRFTSDNVVSFYGASSSTTPESRSKFSLLAPGETQAKVAYLALGDSFASGEGDNQGSTYYEPGTDVAENKCHLSRRSYPYLISSDLNIPDFHSVACSGAETNDITQNAQKGRKVPELNPMGEWLPGVNTQIDYLKKVSNPIFLSLSVGGNNVGFAAKITECATSHFKIPLPNTCKYAGDLAERSKAAEQIADQYDQLKDVYKAVVGATNSKTKIYVVGYPQFIQPTGGSCGNNVHLNDEERQFVAASTHYMNEVIKAAADAAGVYYLDIENALEGRNLCSITSDAQMAVNGITEGNDKSPFWWIKYFDALVPSVAPAQNIGVGNESFHPNSTGQRLMHDKIMSLTNNDPGSFSVCALPNTVTCPHGSDTIPLPDQNYFGSDAVAYVNGKNGPSSISLAAAPQLTSLIVDDQPPGNQVHMHIDYLLPGSTVTVSNQSTPTDLGSYTVGQAGVFDAVVTVPEGTEPGFHTLHVLGKNIAGEQKEYYEHIFVPGPIGDINGNGIPDTEDPCGFATPSGQDKDYDGIDDACDGDIGPAPLPPTVSFTAPTAGSTLSAVTQLLVNAQDERGIAGVQFKVDGNVLGAEDTAAPYSFDWDTKTVSNGSHTLTAVARSTIGLTTTVELQMQVYNLPPPPIVNIISPTDSATISGTVTITAAAQDTEGVAGVQFKIDDTNIAPEASTAPYSVTWDSKAATNGNHTLSATARSVNGQTTTNLITVNVQNQAVAPNSTPPIVKIVQKVIAFIVKLVTAILSIFKK